MSRRWKRHWSTISIRLFNETWSTIGWSQSNPNTTSTAPRYKYGDSEHVNKYKNLILKFHENGKLAVTAVQNLRSDGKWNEREWRMFLPLGLAISNHRSVQLLHFPPDYSLPAQDYLGSKTSQRWVDLLEANGIPLEEVTLYENILDIAPIAAPSNAGSQLKHTTAISRIM